jgi:acetyl esterase/lipase
VGEPVGHPARGELASSGPFALNGAMASEQLQTVLQMLRDNPVAEGDDFPSMRASMEAGLGLLPALDGTETLATEAGGVPAEWVSAPGADPDRVLLYLHGGGYCIGSIATHRSLVARLSAASGARVLNVDYRLAPENPFPAAVDDGVAAYRWLLGEGADPSRVAIGGDSAGGGLTAATLLALRDAGERLPAAGVLLSPWTDLTFSGESHRTRADEDPMVGVDGLRLMADAYRGSEDAEHPLVSPLLADLTGLPALLIQVGTAEVLLDDATSLAKRAEAADVAVSLEVWDEMIHVFQAFAPLLPEAQQAIDRIGAYLRERWQ